MILQRIRIFVVDVGFEPGTSAPEVWCATNEPPHLQIQIIYLFFCLDLDPKQKFSIRIKKKVPDPVGYGIATLL